MFIEREGYFQGAEHSIKRYADWFVKVTVHASGLVQRSLRLCWNTEAVGRFNGFIMIFLPWLPDCSGTSWIDRKDLFRTICGMRMFVLVRRPR